MPVAAEARGSLRPLHGVTRSRKTSSLMVLRVALGFVKQVPRKNFLEKTRFAGWKNNHGLRN